MSTKPELSDTIFGAFLARRELLRNGLGAGAIRIIGSRFSPDALALRAFGRRHTSDPPKVSLSERRWRRPWPPTPKGAREEARPLGSPRFEGGISISSEGRAR